MNLPCDSAAAGVAVLPLVFADWHPVQPVPADLEDAPPAAAVADAMPLQLYTDDELEQACAQARNETVATLEAKLQDAVRTERTAVTHICASFANARDRYFRDMEAEVVQLSLAIAARVLQREAEFDPLLLEGVVRVALGKLESHDDTVLQVPLADEERWRAAMRVAPQLKIVPIAAMSAGECRLEAPSGVAELGIRAQLVEVERGFCDLLARRPA